MKPRTPALQSTRVLDQLRERIRYMHYSLNTEKVYVYWVRFFLSWRVGCPLCGTCAAAGDVRPLRSSEPSSGQSCAKDIPDPVAISKA